MSISNDPRLKIIAKQLCRNLRKTQTDAEKIFWKEVRNRKFFGLKFYRQYPIFVDFDGRETFFIADFFCFEKNKVVEIDGKIHDYCKDHDQLRTEIINRKGIEVVRFKNEDIENDIDSVLKRLEEKFGVEI